MTIVFIFNYNPKFPMHIWLLYADIIPYTTRRAICLRWIYNSHKSTWKRRLWPCFVNGNCAGRANLCAPAASYTESSKVFCFQGFCFGVSQNPSAGKQGDIIFHLCWSCRLRYCQRMSAPDKLNALSCIPINVSSSIFIAIVPLPWEAAFVSNQSFPVWCRQRFPDRTW